MREIKFRGKRVDNGKWVYGYFVDNKVGNCFIIQVYDGDKIVHNVIEVDPTTVCQYTGINDKNNVEIYENDVIECFGQLREVCFVKGSYKLLFLSEPNGDLQRLEYVHGHSEVVGNIYDSMIV